jgi:hypothetical protein
LFRADFGRYFTCFVTFWRIFRVRWKR